MHSSEQSQVQRGEIRFNTAGLFGVHFQHVLEVRSVFQTNTDITTGAREETERTLAGAVHVNGWTVNQKSVSLQATTVHIKTLRLINSSKSLTVCRTAAAIMT